MKKILIGTILSFVLISLLAMPVLASLDIHGIYYNFNAADNEAALTVDWVGRPPFVIKANEFQLGGSLKTIMDVEESIQVKFDDLLVDKENLNSYPPEDPVRQAPPDLGPGQEIIENFLWSHKAYFRIHIYTIDDLGTPGSELRFITRFQNPNAGPIPDNWWE